MPIRRDVVTTAYQQQYQHRNTPYDSTVQLHRSNYHTQTERRKMHTQQDKLTNGAEVSDRKL
jgi:hypothetical protein